MKDKKIKFDFDRPELFISSDEESNGKVEVAKKSLANDMTFK